MNNSLLYTRNYYNSFFYISIVLLVIKTFANASEILFINETIDNVLFVIIIIGIIIKIINTPIPIKELIIIGVVGICSLYSGITTDNYYVFITWLVYAGCYKTNLNKLIKSIVFTTVVLVAIHSIIYMIMYAFGEISASAISKSFGIVYGHTLFMGNANMAGTYILWGMLGCTYLYIKSLNHIRLLLLLIIVVVSYLVTTSRTTLILGLLSVLLCFLYIHGWILIKVQTVIVKYGFIIVSVISVFCCKTLSTGNTILQGIDYALSGRLRYCAFALNYFGITLFGKNIDLLSNYGEVSNWSVTRIAVDILPIRLIMHYGLVFLLLFALVIIIATKYMSIFERLLMSIIIIESLFEIYPVNAIICFPLAVACWYISNRKLLIMN